VASTKERGDQSEKYASEFMYSRGYAVDLLGYFLFLFLQPYYRIMEKVFKNHDRLKISSSPSILTNNERMSFPYFPDASHRLPHLESDLFFIGFVYNEK
jgi:hypothetical protein